MNTNDWSKESGVNNDAAPAGEIEQATEQIASPGSLAPCSQQTDMATVIPDAGDITVRRQKPPFYKKRRFWVAVVAGVVILAIIVGLFSCGQGSTDWTLTTATVERGDISTTVVGSGSLEYESSHDVKMSSAVTIDKTLVEEGEMVEAGMPLATVNPVSVISRITEVEDILDQLDDQIAAVETNSRSQTVKAGISGRVKAVYAHKGDAVLGVMVANGAMAIISTDGLMAVDISADGLAGGDAVVITLSDGTQHDGVVERVADGCTITLTDDGPQLNDTVTISDKDANTLGTGQLYVHQPYAVMAVSGTVSSVNVENGDKVSSGSTVFRLTGVAQDSEYLSLISQRADYAEELNTLLAMSVGYTIKAPVSGIVESGSGSDTTTQAADSTVDYSAYMNYGFSSGSSAVLDKLSELAGAGSDTQIASTSLASLARLSPVTGSTRTTTLSDPVTNMGYTGTVEWTPSTGTTFAAGTEYTALITLTPAEGYAFADDEQSYLSDLNTAFATAGVRSLEIADGTDAGTIQITVAFNATAAESPQPTYPSIDYSDYSLGSYSTSSYSAAQTSVSTDDLLSTAFTIYSDSDMMLSISVDELDILSVAQGQEAVISLDALEGEEFAGHISSVSRLASSSGSSAMYEVRVSIDKDERMLAGMSATATITVAQSSDVLRIPVSAINESGTRIYVYTQMEDDILGGETDVVTGLSDGIYVEILSGLDEGQTVYYHTAGTDIYSMFARGQY